MNLAGMTGGGGGGGVPVGRRSTSDSKAEVDAALAASQAVQATDLAAHRGPTTATLTVDRGGVGLSQLRRLQRHAQHCTYRPNRTTQIRTNTSTSDNLSRAF